MAKPKKVPETAPANEKVEITITTYWPTRIIKSIHIKDLTSDSSFRDEVTLDRTQAKYLFEQLTTLYGTANAESEVPSAKAK